MAQRRATEIFEGTMLSDGTITGRNKGPQFQLALSGEEHLDWLRLVRDALLVLGVYVSAAYPKTITRSRWGKQYDYCYVQSGSGAFLREQAERWYPHNRKEVPEDFFFTPESLANEFMGDGSSSIPERDPGTVFVVLCTQNYDIASIERIERALNSVGVNYTGRHFGKKGDAGISVSVLQESVNDFMDIVEPYILPSFKYKIKRKEGERWAQVSTMT